MTTAVDADDTRAAREGFLARIALGFTLWAERWFPDAYVFVALAVILVSLAALGNGAPPQAIAKAFGDGFWSLIPFTMQMTFVVIGGYVAASSPPVARLIQRSGSHPWRRPERHRLRGLRHHAGLAPELGFQPHFRRASGAGAGTARRSHDGLPRRWRRCLSRPRRDLGAGLKFVRRSACSRTRQACPSRSCRSPG